MYSTGASSLSTSFYTAPGVTQCHTRAIGRIDKSWRNHMILYHPKAEYQQGPMLTRPGKDCNYLVLGLGYASILFK